MAGLAWPCKSWECQSRSSFITSPAIKCAPKQSTTDQRTGSRKYTKTKQNKKSRKQITHHINHLDHIVCPRPKSEKKYFSESAAYIELTAFTGIFEDDIEQAICWTHHIASQVVLGKAQKETTTKGYETVVLCVDVFPFSLFYFIISY